MLKHVTATHTIQVAAPIAKCHMFFTPAGEELWVDGWRPTYLSPDSGHTEQGMIFTTGTGRDHTIWCLTDFDQSRHYSRYSRVTPESRAGTVEIRCTEIDHTHTGVEVTYVLTALSDEGNVALSTFEGDSYRQMIEGWKHAIDLQLDQLCSATIR